MPKRLLVLLTAFPALGAQEERPATALEQALRPPPLRDVELTTWPHFRPLEEQASEDGLRRLGEGAARPEELKLTTPIERALLQGKLWAFFDARVRSWRDVDPARLDVRGRRGPLAEPVQAKPEASMRAAVALMRSLALREEEIAALPDPYARTVGSRRFPPDFDPARPAEPFLPADLWDPEGPWVSLGNEKDLPLARRHAAYFGGRAAFHVFLRVPEGRAAGLALVRRLADYDGRDPQGGPRIPAGTQAALVERSFLLRPDGTIALSPLVEVVELRVHHQPQKRFGAYRSDDVQSIHRFRLRHDLLRSGDPAPLRPRGPAAEDGESVLQLLETGRAGPWTARGSSLVHCHSCHSFPNAQAFGIFELRAALQPAAGALVALAPAEESARARRWKEGDPAWKELRALWK